MRNFIKKLTKTRLLSFSQFWFFKTGGQFETGLFKENPFTL